MYEQVYFTKPSLKLVIVCFENKSVDEKCYLMILIDIFIA